MSSATAVQPYVRWFGGTQIDIALNTGAGGQITKIVAYNPDGTEFDGDKVPSDRDENFIYEIGKTVSVNDFDDDRWNECGTGIHFFMNRENAINY